MKFLLFLLVVAGALFATNPDKASFKEFFESENSLSTGGFERENFFLFSLYKTKTVGIDFSSDSIIKADQKTYLGILTKFVEL